MSYVVTSITDAIGDMANSLIGVVGDVIPVCLPVMAAVVACGLAIRLFKRFIY